MKKHFFVLVMLISILFSSCRTQCPPLTDIQKADIEKQILKLWDEITLAIENVDALGYSDFFSSDEFIPSYSGVAVFNTKEALIDTVKVWFSHRTSNQLNDKEIKVTVFTDSIVLLDQLCNFKINFKEGNTIQIKDALSVLFQKGNTGWKIIHVHESYNPL